MFVDMETGQPNAVVLLYDGRTFVEGRDLCLRGVYVYYKLGSLNVLQSNV